MGGHFRVVFVQCVGELVCWCICIVFIFNQDRAIITLDKPAGFKHDKLFHLLLTVDDRFSYMVT